jgi:hypothetical protein
MPGFKQEWYGPRHHHRVRARAKRALFGAASDVALLCQSPYPNGYKRVTGYLAGSVQPEDPVEHDKSIECRVVAGAEYAIYVERRVHTLARHGDAMARTIAERMERLK